MRFENRQAAGKLLAKKLVKYKGALNTMVLAIPRGALVIGYELSTALTLPLDVILTKKIGAPGNEEFAIGAVDLDGKVFLNERVIKELSVSGDYLKKQTTARLKVLRDKMRFFRGTDELPSYQDQTLIIVDDGVATGHTMKAAIAFARAHGAKKIAVAIPVATSEAVSELRNLADEVVCLYVASHLTAIGEFYDEFPQVSDEEAKNYLIRAEQAYHSP